MRKSSLQEIHFDKIGYINQVLCSLNSADIFLFSFEDGASVTSTFLNCSDISKNEKTGRDDGETD